MTVCIQTQHLTKCYKSVVALSGLTLSVERGEVFALLGANGAGKSTTLYMMSGLVPPTSGQVTIFGKDIAHDFLDIAGRIGVLPERPSFHHHLTARQNLKVLTRLGGQVCSIDRALDRVGLLRAANRRAGGFSTGMLQRLGLAQALMHEPDLLLLDEPTNGLDPESTRDILKLLRSLADEAGVTTVFSSHMLQEVEEFADRVAILSQGRLLSCEDTCRLLSYDTKQVEILTDSPEPLAARLSEQHWAIAANASRGRVTLELGDCSVNHLMTYLVNSGFAVNGVIPKRRSLHDYYLKVLNS